jgi:hypothetical protein
MFFIVIFETGKKNFNLKDSNDRIMKKDFRYLTIVLTIVLIIFFAGCSKNKSNKKALFVVEIDGKNGCIDSNGKIIIEPRFDAINFGIYEGLIPFKENDNWGFLDKNGKIIIEPHYNRCMPFSDGLAVVQDNNDKYGYVNKKGEWVINPIYDFASSFEKGLAYVAIQNTNRNDGFFEITDRLAGIINMKGQIVVPIEYLDILDSPGICGDMIVFLNKDFNSYVFNNKGKFLFSKDSIIHSYNNGLALCNKIGTKPSCYIDINGNVKLQLNSKFTSLGDFSEGLARVQTFNGKWGYIDTNGNMKIDSKYDRAFDFSDGFARVMIGQKTGYINNLGKLIIQSVYDEANDFSNGLAYVKIGKKEGYINPENKWIWFKSN